MAGHRQVIRLVPLHELLHAFSYGRAESVVERFDQVVHLGPGGGYVAGLQGQHFFFCGSAEDLFMAPMKSMSDTGWSTLSEVEKGIFSLRPYTLELPA